MVYLRPIFMRTGCKMSEKSSGIWKKIITVSLAIGGVYFIMEAMAKKKAEGKEINENNPYLDKAEIPFITPSAYERAFKPVLDKALAFTGLAVLSPLFAVIHCNLYRRSGSCIFYAETGRQG